ncbi:DUF2829 domain-containing protein [Xenorhabdus bovienii]|uniref:Thoeris anti-defense Tad2 family protein n=1 Tax=Xenorhabdus bovienii TaxID=40576 RepID=UPI001EDE96F3|nr:MW1434 family type I TA system toxin [Xenorhabdus bovienii]MCG3463103.1 DUF2829 domain-containing protein [Xenorhabdus bovienii]
MSEINKLSDVDKKCFINPEQYKNNDAVAPVGSYPWAMIQLYLGNLVYRNTWDYPNEYIGLVPESEVGEGDNLPYILKKRIHNNFEQWQPAQEDMMACDWVKMDFMLSFDVFIGTANATLQGSEGHVAWGYVKDGYKWDEQEWSKSFGDLKVIQNKTGIVETTSFYWHVNRDHSDGVILWLAYSGTSQESFHNLINFFQTKELHITVDGVTYNLGKSLDITTKQEYGHVIDNVYKNNDAKKLGVILKHTGVTKRLYVNWI